MRLPVVAAAAVAALAVQLAGAVDAPGIGILTVPSTSDEPCATLVSLQLADPLQSCVAFFYERWLVVRVCCLRAHAVDVVRCAAARTSATPHVIIRRVL